MGRKNDQSIHAIYSGDNFLDLGTLEELSERFNMKRKTLQWLKSPTAHKRMTGERNGMIVIEIEDDEGEINEC
jgi:hypothetical protein